MPLALRAADVLNSLVGLRLGNAGGVDDAVQRAKARDGPVEHGAHLGFVGHIGAHQLHLGAECFQRLDLV